MLCVPVPCPFQRPQLRLVALLKHPSLSLSSLSLAILFDFLSSFFTILLIPKPPPQPHDWAETVFSSYEHFHLYLSEDHLHATF